MNEVDLHKPEQISVNSIPLPASLFQLPEYFVRQAREDEAFVGYAWCADELAATLKDLQLFSAKGRGSKRLPISLCTKRDGKELETRLYEKDVNIASLAFRELFYQLSDAQPLIDERTEEHPFGRIVSKAYSEGLAFYVVETHIEDEDGPYMIVDVSAQLPADMRDQMALRMSREEAQAMRLEVTRDIAALLSGQYGLDDLNPTVS